MDEKERQFQNARSRKFSRADEKAEISDPQKRAGLLFQLLSGKARSRILPHLSSGEIDLLLKNYSRYKSETKNKRTVIEKNLLKYISRPQWPAFLFSAGMVLFAMILIFHNAARPALPALKRMELFTPLFLGACSPLAVYLIPAYRFRMLFQIKITFEIWTVAFITFMVLLWLIVYIRIEETLPAGHLPFLSLLILSLAALSAPFAEEILFREALPSLMGNHPHFIGHLVSALCFGIAHLPASPYMGFLYFLSALFLSLLRYHSDSLFFPYAAHSLANVSSLYI